MRWIGAVGNRRQRRIKEAHFPLLKELADFDFACVPQLNRQQVLELAQGHYLDQAETVLLVGNPGLGKTPCCDWVGADGLPPGLPRALLHRHPPHQRTARGASQPISCPTFWRKHLRHQLIILDEFGYVPFSPTGAQLLFQFCAALHERVSVLITTNLPFSEWVQVLGDERLTSGLLDRLTFRCHILEFVGDSYRFRQALARQAATAGPQLQAAARRHLLGNIFGQTRGAKMTRKTAMSVQNVSRRANPLWRTNQLAQHPPRLRTVVCLAGGARPSLFLLRLA